MDTTLIFFILYCVCGKFAGPNFYTFMVSQRHPSYCPFFKDLLILCYLKNTPSKVFYPNVNVNVLLQAENMKHFKSAASIYSEVMLQY